MALRFSFDEGRVERLIAVGRVVLASFSLLAVWLDPSEPAKYATLTYVLLAAYVLYALLVTSVVWVSHGRLRQLRLPTHIFDLALFSIFMYLTEAPTSPFFVYFVFSMVCATLRWQWRGTLWTAAAALASFLGMGCYAAKVLQDPAFELNRFIIRGVYLAVVAALLGYLGAHESHRRGQLAKLAAWPRDPLLEAQEVLRRVLEQAGSIVQSPRALVAWEESQEPWLHLVMFSEGRLQWSRKAPGTFHSLVAQPLVGKSFFSQDVRSSTVAVADTPLSDVRRWRGEPLNRDLEKLYSIRSVLSVDISGENLRGRLFFLDKSPLTSDDLILAEVVAGQAATSLDLFYFLRRLQQLAAVEERIRLARDLHDGVLQSLTAIGFRLQTSLQVLKANPEAVREQLEKIQDLIVEAQRELRSFVEELKVTTPVPGETDFGLGQMLGQLSRSVERQWNLRVELIMNCLEAQVPANLAREIYRVVREGLINAARHSHGSVARVELGIGDCQVRINISDNGRGFPFRGYFDQAALTATGMGPAMLKNRVGSLKGTLSIHSSEAGARLDITLPLPQPGA